ncbi:Mg-chelatase subunit ChlI [Halodesulfurarchaeum formicicum]|uniref:Magnesium chelatase subunit D n=1 Tax=Halodesulfurarchaeum formicicum TaxID=1873524 RepID=A0A1D8S6M3_9EURY|nr:VWA domain-containing protein [Halodesulfurarchaeum formicicum]AOW81012.1 Mg-chelatase subunit ChlI [Halodesulfurarchaeum formicicum]APE96348.1 magnesium chelatase subunit D [Halodesulfurarchaeum formicicum]
MVGFQSDVPFPAIVGQDRLKRALLAVAANDAIDGLLIQGEKGTAKSTAVRGLVDLLPTQRAVADCPYGCPPDDPARQCDSCRTRTDPPVETRPVPLVTVPLGATRERVVGSLSLSDALDGESTFEPGLLAQANRGFLYVDEVNLLDDHLVDVLLDAAASGVNRVERDGVSETHPADFTLIGTMNPEEGDLRPQLRDRFALQVEVTGSEDLDERVAIVESALERDPTSDPAAAHQQDIQRLRETLLDARAALETVALPTELAETIAEVCVDAGVDGHRGDIAAARAARTFAALDGRETVREADVETALRYALPHRLQSRPFEDHTPLEDVLADHFGDDPTPPEPESQDEESTAGDAEPEDGAGDQRRDQRQGRGEGDGNSTAGGGGDSDTTGSDDSNPEDGDSNRSRQPESPPDARSESGGTGGRETEAEPGDGQEAGRDDDDSESADQTGDEDDPDAEASPDEETARPPPGIASPSPGSSAAPDLQIDPSAQSEADPVGSGRAETDPAVDADGPRIRTAPAESAADVDVAASVREGAKRGSEPLERRDLRQSVRAGSATALVVFAVDASASMRPAMRAAKGTVLELLKESYEERDEVAFVAFAGDDAEVLLPPTDSVSLAARHLKDLPAGDRTPLPAGLETASELIERADPAVSVAVVVTDGRPNVATGSPTAATREAATTLGETAGEVLVVDASQPGDRAALIDDLVTAAGARAIPLEELSEASVQAVRKSAND